MDSGSSSGAARRVLKTVLLAGGASLLLANGAWAADAAATSSDAAVSEVVVTGTSIRGVAPVGSALTTVSRDDIKASGAISTTELLNKTPQIFNVGVSDSSRGNTGGSSNITYGSSINIRGISPYETLTLVDGFRAVQQEARAEIVDPSHIPTNMLQRVEIVADGGSAIYGSDAVAGVANLILRRHFEGEEVSLRYGDSTRGYQEKVGQITVGHTWDLWQADGRSASNTCSTTPSSSRSFPSTCATRLPWAGPTSARQAASRATSRSVRRSTPSRPAA